MDVSEDLLRLPGTGVLAVSHHVGTGNETWLLIRAWSALNS